MEPFNLTIEFEKDRHESLVKYPLSLRTPEAIVYFKDSPTTPSSFQTYEANGVLLLFDERGCPVFGGTIRAIGQTMTHWVLDCRIIWGYLRESTRLNALHFLSDQAPRY